MKTHNVRVVPLILLCICLCIASTLRWFVASEPFAKRVLLYHRDTYGAYPHFYDGIHQTKQGSITGALDAFRQSYALLPAYETAMNIQALEMLLQNSNTRDLESGDTDVQGDSKPQETPSSGKIGEKDDTSGSGASGTGSSHVAQNTTGTGEQTPGTSTGKSQSGGSNGTKNEADTSSDSGELGNAGTQNPGSGNSQHFTTTGSTQNRESIQEIQQQQAYLNELQNNAQDYLRNEPSGNSFLERIESFRDEQDPENY